MLTESLRNLACELLQWWGGLMGRSARLGEGSGFESDVTAAAGVPSRRREVLAGSWSCGRLGPSAVRRRAGRRRTAVVGPVASLVAVNVLQEEGDAVAGVGNCCEPRR